MRRSWSTPSCGRGRDRGRARFKTRLPRHHLCVPRGEMASDGPWTHEDHAQTAKDITRVWKSFGFYLEEMQTKKARRRRKNGVDQFVFNRQDHRFCKKFVMHNMKYVYSSSTFPCTFQGLLDSAMWLECSEDPDEIWGTYYCDSEKGWTSNLPPLDSKPVLTEGDRELIMALNREYIALMKRCVEKVTKTLPRRYNDKIKEMREWLVKVEKLCGDP